MNKPKTYQNIKSITEKLEQGIIELFTSDKYRTWLQTMSKFHDYSLNNTLLIAFQKPDATMVAGYNSWKKDFGRQVKKGEKAIQILAPISYKKTIEIQKTDPVTNLPILDSTGAAVIETKEITIASFQRVNVFDISQTEGKELPTLGVQELSGNVDDYNLFVEILKKCSPVPITFENIQGSAKGYYQQVEKRIAIQEGMSQVQTIKTLIHEISHAKLHSIDNKNEFGSISRRSKEVEAESIAYTVCQHFGIDTSDYSFAYIAGWSSGKDMKELKCSLALIRDAASELITDIHVKSKEIKKEKYKSLIKLLGEKKNKVILADDVNIKRNKTTELSLYGVFNQKT